MGSSDVASTYRYITTILMTWNNMQHSSLSCFALNQCPGLPNKYFGSAHIVESKMKELGLSFSNIRRKKVHDFPIFFSPDTEAKPAILSSVKQQPYWVMRSSFVKHIRNSIHVFF